MRSTGVRKGLRVLAAIAVVAGGVLHINTWRTDYRGDHLPGSVPGSFVVKVGFPVNAAVSVLVAIALVLLAERLIVTWAALLFELACILTLVLSRTTGVLGWKEEGWTGKTNSVLAAEVAASALLMVVVALEARAHGPGPAGADASLDAA